LGAPKRFLEEGGEIDGGLDGKSDDHTLNHPFLGGLLTPPEDEMGGGKRSSTLGKRTNSSDKRKSNRFHICPDPELKSCREDCCGPANKPGEEELATQKEAPSRSVTGRVPP